MRGILLALAGDAIRVALEDCGDVAEYRRVGSGWISEFGDSVNIDWIGPVDGDRIPLPLSADTDARIVAA